jgi:hypothetical protein
MQREPPDRKCRFSLRTQGMDDEGKRELRLRFAVTSSANFNSAAYRENSREES